MRIALVFITLSLIAAESDVSTPIPSETPEQLIVEGVIEAIPEAVTIISECLGGHKPEAAAQIIGCIVDEQSPAHKVAKGSVLCCIRCCKKKRQ